MESNEGTRVVRALAAVMILVLVTSNEPGKYLAAGGVVPVAVPPSSFCQRQQVLLQIKVLRTANWEGYFTDSRTIDGKPPGNKWLFDVNLKMEPNNYQFSATGYDDFGHFTMKHGIIKGCKLQFLKVYSTHSILYQGVTTGVQVVGHWWLVDAPCVKGRWAMWPVRQTTVYPNT